MGFNVEVLWELQKCYEIVKIIRFEKAIGKANKKKEAVI